MAETDYWKAYKLRPGKILVRYERNDTEKVTESGLVIPKAWTKTYGEGAGRTEVINERDPVTDIAVVMAIGPSFYDANGNFQEQPCAVGDRIWSNRIWGRGVPDPNHGDADELLRLISFSDVLALVDGSPAR